MPIMFCNGCRGGVVVSQSGDVCPVCGSEGVVEVTPGNIVDPAPAQSYYRHVWTLKAPHYQFVELEPNP